MNEEHIIICDGEIRAICKDKRTGEHFAHFLPLSENAKVEPLSRHMDSEHSKIIQNALLILKQKVAGHFFYEEYGKYLHNKQSFNEFRAKIDAFEIEIKI